MDFDPVPLCCSAHREIWLMGWTRRLRVQHRRASETLRAALELRRVVGTPPTPADLERLARIESTETPALEAAMASLGRHFLAAVAANERALCARDFAELDRAEAERLHRDAGPNQGVA